MNKLAPLLLLLFLSGLPTGKSTAAPAYSTGCRWIPAPVEPIGAAPQLIRRLPASASAVRALARLLRAYAETPSAQQEPFRATTTA